MSDPTRELDITPTDFDTLAALDEAVPKHPHDPDHINPKISSDIAYWARRFHVSGQLLHEAIGTHGTSVEKVRAALAHHQVGRIGAGGLLRDVLPAGAEHAAGDGVEDLQIGIAGSWTNVLRSPILVLPIS